MAETPTQSKTPEGQGLMPEDTPEVLAADKRALVEWIRSRQPDLCEDLADALTTAETNAEMLGMAECWFLENGFEEAFEEIAVEAGVLGSTEVREKSSEPFAAPPGEVEQEQEAVRRRTILDRYKALSLITEAQYAELLNTNFPEENNLAKTIYRCIVWFLAEPRVNEMMDELGREKEAENGGKALSKTAKKGLKNPAEDRAIARVKAELLERHGLSEPAE